MVTAVLSGISILFIKNLFRAVLLLLVILLCIAGIYVLSMAEFLAIAQILIYAGGIVVVILFGIMLTSKISGTPLIVKNTNTFIALVIGGLLIYLLGSLLTETFAQNSTSTVLRLNTTRETGISLMTTHLIAFEVAAVLLLAALIGAALISSESTQKDSK